MSARAAMGGAGLLAGLALGAVLAGAPGERAGPAASSQPAVITDDAPTTLDGDPLGPGAAGAPYRERTEGRKVLEGRCGLCHGEGLIAEQRLTEAQWKAELAKMRRFGAPLPEGSPEERALLEHLSRTRHDAIPGEPPPRERGGP